MAPQPASADAAAGGSHFHQAVQLLTRRSGRLAQVAKVLVVGAAVNEIVQKARRKARDATEYRVAVPDDDEIFEDMQAWLIANLPSRRRRALTARTQRRGRNMLISATPDSMPGEEVKPPPPPPPVHLSYDGSQTQTVPIEGHRVRVEVEKQERNRIGVQPSNDRDFWHDPQRIVFRCQGTGARDAVLRLIESLAAARVVVDEPRTRLYISSRWGDWNRRPDLPTRTLDTVILRDGLVDSIVTDMDRFFAQEAMYAKVGLPWHRGYVFHGPPGTGKTSLAKALAEHFKLDAYYIPLSDLDSDGRLLGLFGGVTPRSMLLLEDVDVVHAAVSRDDAESQGVSMSGLLNALDGLATPHGLVSVMTTNRLEVLDDAILRAGRADRIEELGYLDNDQLTRLVALLAPGFEYEMHDLGSITGLVHADIVEAAKPHLDDPAEAALSIDRLLVSRKNGHEI